MTRRICTIPVAALLLLLAATPSAAQPADEVARGIELYQDLEYEQAAEVLEAALEAPGLADERRIEGYQHLALSYLALRREDDARAAFTRLLEVDREFRLPTTVSQTARDLLEEARRALPPPKVTAVDTPPAVAQLSQTASPAQPREGTTVSVTILVADPGDLHDRVLVHHRVRGSKSYSAVTAMRTGEGRYAATVPGMFVGPPALEYYVVAVDAEGGLVASEGSEAEPLALAVDSPVAAAGAPVYKKWWFWAGVGTAVLAGTVGVLALTGDDPPSPESTVTITVNP
jgi:tetratricopeptide (TPR) repeat protein